MTSRAVFPLLPNGDKMAVIRPSDPARAIEVARGHLGSSDSQVMSKMLAQLMEEMQYTYVGILAYRYGNPKRGFLADEEGNEIGEVQPGDSFVSYEEVKESLVRSEALEAGADALTASRAGAIGGKGEPS